MTSPSKSISLFLAFLPIVFLVGLLILNVNLFSDNATSGPNQMALIFSAGIAAIIAYSKGLQWPALEKGILKSIQSAMPAILILLLIGALSGTWIISGIVPAMIYYGLKVLSPSVFLFASCFICSVVSIATGSSWTTVATVGLALSGVGETLGFPAGLVGGAIISGAYFGDKLSPLSDTTNLASAMAGVNLFTHIRYMLFTTIPSITIALILYIIFGLSQDNVIVQSDLAGVLNALSETFYISPVLLLVPLGVIVLVLLKIPAFPALLIGSLAGGIAAIIFQKDVLFQIVSADSYLETSYSAVLKAMYTSIQVVSGNKILDNLLSSSGMEGMLNTVWLILCAMIFGGVMEVSGLLGRITYSLVKIARSTVALISSTVGTCIFFNLTASDQYLAIVVPGKMFRKAYEDKNLLPQNLSRTLEDSGTVTSPLIPWNTCGAAQATVLGIATFAYAPYSFFNLISPVITILFAYFNIRIARKNTSGKAGH